jgi:hypothetical protein
VSYLPRGSGCRGGICFGARLGWLRETQSEGLELRDLVFAQFREPFRHVLDRFSEPLFNMFCIGADDATTHDVLEQLVACLLKGRGFHWSCEPTRTCVFLRLGHVYGFEGVTPEYNDIHCNLHLLELRISALKRCRSDEFQQE